MSIITAAASSLTSPSTLIVLGLGIALIGLICLIVLCRLMGRIVNVLEGNHTPEVQEAPAAVSAPQTASAPVSAAAPIENKQELIAAISAVIAEELGTDVSAIRIKSIKKI